MHLHATPPPCCAFSRCRRRREIAPSVLGVVTECGDSGETTDSVGGQRSRRFGCSHSHTGSTGPVHGAASGPLTTARFSRRRPAPHGPRATAAAIPRPGTAGRSEPPAAAPAAAANIAAVLKAESELVRLCSSPCGGPLRAAAAIRRATPGLEASFRLRCLWFRALGLSSGGPPCAERPLRPGPRPQILS